MLPITASTSSSTNSLSDYNNTAGLDDVEAVQLSGTLIGAFVLLGAIIFCLLYKHLRKQRRVHRDKKRHHLPETEQVVQRVVFDAQSVRGTSTPRSERDESLEDFSRSPRDSPRSLASCMSGYSQGSYISFVSQSQDDSPRVQQHNHAERATDAHIDDSRSKAMQTAARRKFRSRGSPRHDTTEQHLASSPPSPPSPTADEVKPSQSLLKGMRAANIPGPSTDSITYNHIVNSDPHRPVEMKPSYINRTVEDDAKLAAERRSMSRSTAEMGRSTRMSQAASCPMPSALPPPILSATQRRSMSSSLIHQPLVEEEADELEFETSSTKGDNDSELHASKEHVEGWFEGIVNMAERATGIDLDNDGDVGLPGSPSKKVFGQNRVLGSTKVSTEASRTSLVLGNTIVDA